MSSTLLLSDITISQMALTRRKGSIPVVGAHPRYRMDKLTNQRSEDIEGYNVDILVNCNPYPKIQTIKLPIECDEVAQKVTDALKAGKKPWVSFNGFQARPYAFLKNGQIISGFSAIASSMILDRTEEPDDLLDFDDDIIE